MENASKALIMAGGILIGIIILTIATYSFMTFGSTSKEIQKQVDARVISDFNNNFLKYQGMKECTIHDVVSLANFANKNNVDFKSGDDYYVSIYLDKEELTAKASPEEYYIKLLEVDRNYTTSTGKTQYYTCSTIKYSEVEGYQRVNSVIFKKN